MQDYDVQYYDFFCESTGIKPDKRDFEKMFDEETKWEQRRTDCKLPESSVAKHTATKRMVEWYRSADEYHFKNAAELIANHRRACCWAILLQRRV